MKKEIVFLSALAAVAASAQTFPAGIITVDSGNNDTPIYYLSKGTQAPSEMFVEIMASPAGANIFQSIDLMSETKNTVYMSDLGGANGNAYYFFEGSVIAPNITPGASGDFIVRAWTGAATYEAATLKAESAVITQNTAIWSDPKSPAPDNYLNFNQALVVGVPEPATLALLAIGGAALFFRRRQ